MSENSTSPVGQEVVRTAAVAGELANIAEAGAVEEPLAVLAGKIKAAHNAVLSALRSSLSHAKRAGEYLALVRASGMSYVRWVEWVKTKTGLSEASANNYVRIHQNWQDVSHEENYSLALKALRKSRKGPKGKPAAPNEPEPEPDELGRMILAAAKEAGVKGTVGQLLAFMGKLKITKGILAELNGVPGPYKPR